MKASYNIVFREAVSSDIDFIANLETVCFKDPWSRAAIRDEIDKNPMSLYMVAEDTDIKQVIGYAGLWQIFDEGNITNIAVDPKRRREGIGDRLVGELVRNSMERGMISFTLEVRVSNSPAISLYERHGFEIAGIRPGYYVDGEDAYIMWLYTEERKDNK